MRQPIRILGIDPGLRRTGWGVIDVDGNRLIHVACGSVASDDKAALAQRARFAGSSFFWPMLLLPALEKAGRACGPFQPSYHEVAGPHKDRMQGMAARLRCNIRICKNWRSALSE